MKISINSEIFRKVTASIGKIPPPKDPDGPYGSILVVAQKDSVSFVVINEDLQVEVTLATGTEHGVAVFEEGIATIPAKKLLQLTKKVDPGVKIRLLSKREDKTQIAIGPGSFKLNSRIIFPRRLLFEFDDTETCFVAGRNVLRDAIKNFQPLYTKARGAYGQFEELGICFAPTDTGVMFTATDHHRLVRTSIPLVEKMSKDFSLLEKRDHFRIPTQLFGHCRIILSQAQEDAHVEFRVHQTIGGSMASFFVQSGVFTCSVFQLIITDKGYPDVSFLFDKKHPYTATVEEKPLREAVGRLSPLTNALVFSFKKEEETGELTIRGIKVSSSFSHETLDCDLADFPPGKVVHIGMNITYFMELLRTIFSPEMTLSFTSGLAPIVMCPKIDPVALEAGKNHQTVVSPLKIKGWSTA